MKLFSLILGGLIFLVPHSYSAYKSSMFETGEHCVAYKAKKRMFLIRNVDVVGKNCSVSSQLLPEVGGLYFYQLNIPSGKFESGETKRDLDVKKVLKSEVHPELKFVTEKYPIEKWKDLLMSKKSATVPGILTVAGKDFNIKAKVRFNKKSDGSYEVDGVFATRFKDLELQPPSMVGGMMAQVRESLELHFRLQAENTLGMMAVSGSL